MPNHRRRFGLALLAACASSACSPVSYLGHVSYHEARILLAREPVEKVLADPRVDDATKRKIRLVEQAKRFALEIGLSRTGGFLSFVKLDRDWTSLALTAAPPDSLDPYTWAFPIVGRVPYKGFFEVERAKREQKEREDEGYETFLRKVSAFSTLGWFDDPILSPMLTMDDLDLVDTVVHETAHATIFVPSQADFNESLATFVGEEGSLAFVRKTSGEDSPDLARACGLAADEARFSVFLQRLSGKLDEAFRGALKREEKLERKAEIFAEMKQQLRDETPLYRTDRFARFAEMPWNNAMIASMRGYRTNLGLFRSLHAREGFDLARTIARLKGLAESLDGRGAFEALRKLVESEEPGAGRGGGGEPPCASSGVSSSSP